MKIGDIIWIHGKFKATVNEVNDKSVSVKFFKEKCNGLYNDDLKKVWTFQISHAHLKKYESKKNKRDIHRTVGQ